QDRQRRYGLARPALADDADDLARGDLEVDAVHRARHTRGRPEMRAQRLDPEQRAHRSRGSSASRRPSPTRLNASTTSTMARPGNVATHHAPSRLSRPLATMPPHDGVGAGRPSPMKES